MKIDGIPGEYYARCFFRRSWIWSDEQGRKFSTKLCNCWHKSREDANDHHPGAIWPVEIEDGIAYVPSEEELKDAR